MIDQLWVALSCGFIGGVAIAFTVAVLLLRKYDMPADAWPRWTEPEE